MGAHRYIPVLWLGLLFVGAGFAQAESAQVESNAHVLRVKVLSAETRAINGEAEIPRNCALANYSAYCNGNGNPPSQSIMLVEDAEGNSYRIACTSDSRWSRCVPLPVGQSFEASKGKRGITIVSRNAKGKNSKEFYQFLSGAPAPQPETAAGKEPQAVAPPQNAPGPAPASPPAPVQDGLSKEVPQEKIRCNFSSNPSGAEITLDGQYVGSTPSVLGLGPGTHLVVITLPGFAQWKRDLAVSPGSELTVNAVLQKVQ